MYCDSLKGKINSTLKKNLKLFISYLYPSIIEWKILELQDSDRFQKSYLDCGFHILNFAAAAIKDIRIDNDAKNFTTFKYDTWEKYFKHTHIK